MSNNGPQPRLVLVLGASEVSFTESGPELSLAGLMLACLTEMAPAYQWKVEPHTVYQMANMQERSVQLAERADPDLVVLWTGGNPFSEYTVSFAVYRRWPAVYRTVDRWVNRIRRGAGGGIQGGDSTSGVLFRGLRAAGRALIGRNSMIAVEDAFAATVETMEALLPRWPVLVRLAHRNFRQPDQEKPVRLRVGLYNGAVRDACRRLAVPCFDAVREIEDSGIEYRMAPDMLHADLSTRRLNARIGAREVLEALRACGRLEATVTL